MPGGRPKLRNGRPTGGHLVRLYKLAHTAYFDKHCTRGRAPLLKNEYLAIHYES